MKTLQPARLEASRERVSVGISNLLVKLGGPDGGLAQSLRGAADRRRVLLEDLPLRLLPRLEGLVPVFAFFSCVWMLALELDGPVLELHPLIVARLRHLGLSCARSAFIAAMSSLSRSSRTSDSARRNTVPPSAPSACRRGVVHSSSISR